VRERPHLSARVGVQEQAGVVRVAVAVVIIARHDVKRRARPSHTATRARAASRANASREPRVERSTSRANRDAKSSNGARIVANRERQR
jgi:hypothetical protein